MPPNQALLHAAASDLLTCQAIRTDLASLIRGNANPSDAELFSVFVKNAGEFIAAQARLENVPSQLFRQPEWRAQKTYALAQDLAPLFAQDVFQTKAFYAVALPGHSFRYPELLLEKGSLLA
jgi:hypothetical protein